MQQHNNNTTRRIPLTRGLFAIIDEEDAPLVMCYAWHAVHGPGGTHWYAMTKGARSEGHAIMHRFILDAPHDMTVDHINGDTLDNRKANLRICSLADNQRNRSARKNGAQVPFKGVYPSTGGKYRARIGTGGAINRRLIHLGTFTTPEDAATAYDDAAREMHGEFACLNFPKEGERCALAK